MVSDILSIAGIVIGVVLSVGGYLVAKKVVSNRQTQNVKNGTGIQAGGDINLGKVDE